MNEYVKVAIVAASMLFSSGDTNRYRHRDSITIEDVKQLRREYKWMKHQAIMLNEKADSAKIDSL